MCFSVLVWYACSTFFVFVYFRRRSSKSAWNYWGIYWATMRAVQPTLPAALRFITEWLTQAPQYLPLNSYRPSSLSRRCVCICVTNWHCCLYLFILTCKKKKNSIKWKLRLLNLTQASDNIPESTATAIFHLCLDASFGGLLPSMQEAAVAYLEQVNSDSHDLYRRVTRAALWMESTCSFLKEAQTEV